jgi:hypothetical protein
MHSEDVRQFLPRARASGDGRVLETICLETICLGNSFVDENMLSAGRRSAAQRIAALIVILYNIADALGLSLVHANKTLGRLRRLGCTRRPIEP